MKTDRRAIVPDQFDLYLEAGYTVVSVDYRLAPETKLKGIIEDIQDAYRWLLEKGPKLFRIDPDRVAVIGGSAGGYLTLMTGFCVVPRPKALVSFCGYGDIDGPWLSTPYPLYCQQPLVTKEEAYRAVGKRIISEDSGQNNRGQFYLYCRQQGLLPKEVTGHDPHTEPNAFDCFCPVRNVTPDYPPTLLLHGDQDADVPYQQSVLMAEKLSSAGVEHELITIFGGGHGFDAIASGVFNRVLAFLKQHVFRCQAAIR